MDIEIRKKEPAGRRGSRMPARKVKELGFRARTVDLKIRKKELAGRRSSRPPARNDVLPVNRTMKKYKIYLTNNLNFLLADF